MKLVSIVGARPQFVKIAPLSRAICSHNQGDNEQIEELIVHTGQHYDASMSDVFFRELDIPAAAYDLEIGSGSHGLQTGKMLEGIEKVLLDKRPNIVVVYGDTNSTVAGALAAAKLQIPVIHIEAGLRSYNRRMPEEINRVVADHLSDLLLAPTTTAMKNLRKEGLGERALLTGDIMYDAVLFNLMRARQKSTILERLNLRTGNFAVVTVHRAENTDDVSRLRSLLDAFNQIATDDLHLVFPMHPRTAKLLTSHIPDWEARPKLQLIDPVAYLDMLLLLDNARVVLTDSGGLQKEAFFLGCPCVTLRDETEWVETIHSGGNILAGVDPAKIAAAVNTWDERFPQGKTGRSAEVMASFGDGKAADKILQAMLQFSHKRMRRHRVSVQ